MKMKINIVGSTIELNKIQKRKLDKVIKDIDLGKISGDAFDSLIDGLNEDEYRYLQFKRLGDTGTLW
jgi:hypothetical protein